MPPLDPTHKPAGSMTVDFFTTEDGVVYPVISFAPVGRIVPALVDRFLPKLYQEIGLAQVAARSAQAEVETPATRRPRRAA
jgi:hypothetical protein